ARGRGDPADRDLVAVHQPDQGGPHRDPADEVLGRVDRVDDPAARARTDPAELLTQYGITWPGPAQDVAQRLLGGAVGVGHRRQVRFGLHPQVERAEPARGDVARRVGEDGGEPQVVVIPRHGAKRYRLPAAAATPARRERPTGGNGRRIPAWWERPTGGIGRPDPGRWE